ncbi:MAG: hypothetical protein WBZ20_01010 [Nitrososphaeraceae archaeon]
MEKLLQTPMDDYRKNAVGLIPAPLSYQYQKLSYDESFTIIREWLDKCNTAARRRLGFNSNYLIRYNLDYVTRNGSRPFKLETLKERNRQLYLY